MCAGKEHTAWLRFSAVDFLGTPGTANNAEGLVSGVTNASLCVITTKESSTGFKAFVDARENSTPKLSEGGVITCHPRHFLGALK